MSNHGIGSTPTSVPAATTGGRRSTGNPSWRNKSSFHWSLKKIKEIASLAYITCNKSMTSF